ncbi:Rieske (2Fe-2S) protein [Ectobacillus ponti]|uniref:Uncharacterized protein n=1 Tax=Ectobacillus ponti TaxID=2961894 RepID=A0AA42BRG0_9BACI|nr:hypothetical protein [Ectobacillus ponti]MCP8970361.1 hypothetical protein [Ectobacillus ponti]
MAEEQLNRREFLSEVRDSLWQTVRALLRPAAEEKLEQLEEAVQVLEGVRYVEAARIKELSLLQITRKQIGKQAVLLYQAEGQLYAVSEQCPSCGTLLYVNSYDCKISCLSCGTGKKWLTGAGELSLRRHPVKIIRDAIYVGIKD